MSDENSTLDDLIKGIDFLIQVEGTPGIKSLRAWRRVLIDTQADNARLRAIVDRLPRTADGVPIVPGQTVHWHSADVSTLEFLQP